MDAHIDHDLIDSTDSRRSDIHLAFPLFTQHQYETTIGGMGFEVGVLRSFPLELQKRLTAAILSYAGGLNSIDYTLKTYVNRPDYPNYELENERRVDLKIMAQCVGEIKALVEAVKQSIIERGDPELSIGIAIGNYTLLRIPFSLECAFAEANKGALYEAVVIARMILEQIAWIGAISAADDAKKVKRVSVTAAITDMKKHAPMAGKLYGWMSGHAHWTFKAHVKAFEFSGPIAKTRLADSAFKATAYAMLILLTAVVIQTLKTIRSADLHAERLEAFRKSNRLAEKFDAANLIGKIGRVDGAEADLVDLYEILNGRFHG